MATSNEFLAYLRTQKSDKALKEKDIADRRLKRTLKFDEKATKVQDSAKALEPKKTKASYDAGDYVIVNYEGEWFPGLVLSTSKTEKQVKVKTMAGSNWKWPENDDILNYPLIHAMKIAPPTLVSTRGFYSVPEIISIKSVNPYLFNIILTFYKCQRMSNFNL